MVLKRMNFEASFTMCSLLGHFAAAGVPNKRRLAEFRVSADALLPPGTPITAAHFTAGQYVDIQGMQLLFHPISQQFLEIIIWLSTSSAKMEALNTIRVSNTSI